MKNVKLISTLSVLSIAATMVASTAFAINVPGLMPEQSGAQFASVGAFNQNVSAWQQLSAQQLERQLEPYIPGGRSLQDIAKGVTPLLPAGIGRKQVLVVEPVLTGGTPDAAVSGAALATAIQTANAKSYPVVLYVDAGQYTIASSSIALNKNVTLEGAGRNATVVKVNDITSAAPAISQLTLTTSLLTQTQSCLLHNLDINGALSLSGESVVARYVDIVTRTSEHAALTIGKLASFSNLAITASTTGLIVNSATKGTVLNSTFTAPTPISMTANSEVLFANNIYQGGAPHFYGDYHTSKQTCHNNISLPTGLPVPNYASGVSPLCVAPTTGEVEK